MGGVDTGLAGFAQGFADAWERKQNRDDRLKETSEDRALRRLQLQMQARQQGYNIEDGPEGMGLIEDPEFRARERGMMQEKASLGALPAGAIPKFEDDKYTGYSFPQEYIDIENIRAQRDPYGIKGLQKESATQGLIKTKQDIQKNEEELGRAKPDEYKAGGFAKRTAQAEKVFSGLKNKGFNRASPKASLEAAAASLPLIGGFLRSEDLGMQQQAEDNFLNATLRRESGASISPTERESGERQYFDRPGDTDQIREQKRQNRELVIETLKAESGKALGQIKEPGLIEKSSVVEDPNISSYAKQYGLDYKKAEQILRARGYGQ
jgi:hypothetical protein